MNQLTNQHTNKLSHVITAVTVSTSWVPSSDSQATFGGIRLREACTRWPLFSKSAGRLLLLLMVVAGIVCRRMCNVKSDDPRHTNLAMD